MGIIHDQVFHAHLSKYPTEREFILPFLANFDVTYAQRRYFKGTELSIYIIKPDTTIADQFGITSEMVLAISQYKTLQPRTIQAIDEFFQSGVAKGRLEQTVFFIVTPNDCSEWLTNFCSYNQHPRIPISINHKEIAENKSDPWFIRSVISRQMYSRDLFNEQLPLISDNYFFGREKLVADFVNAAKTSQNRGLFGLRKTGKTSLLFKFRRMAEAENVITLYFDCKDPSIRSLRWDQLLNRIITDLGKESSKVKIGPILGSDAHISEKFRATVQSISRRICIIFDEIEYISPYAKLDAHWHEDFIPFWQTIWTTQSQTRRLSFIIAGVNPSIIETDLVNDIQNPIFAIISPEYLTGLAQNEIRSMVHFFGKRMGLKFDHQACDYINERYGGQPMLTRMAGSFINSEMVAQDSKRPTVVSAAFMRDTEDLREDEMAFYCRHIVNELRLFYPDEYEMLEMIASGNEADFIEFARDKNFIKHLINYGLINYDKGQHPSIKIPVLSRFINNERMKRDDESNVVFQIHDASAQNWITNRKLKIVSDSRNLESLIARQSDSPIFGPNGFPETEYFLELEICNGRGDFTDFINTCNRCFVESVSNLGKSMGKKNYLNDVIAKEYPDLYDALIRVRLYRNNIMHLLLYDGVDAQLRSRLVSDFKGQPLSSVEHPYRLLQQVVLDGLFVGFQLEIDKRS